MTETGKPRLAAKLLMQIICLFIGLGVPMLEGRAQENTGTSGANCSYDKFKEAVGVRESNGDYGAVNSYGYMGKYQFGKSALIETGYMTSSGAWTGKNGVTSQESWLSNGSAQESAMNELVNAEKRQAQAKGLYKYVGQTINGVTITESGIVGGCHLIGCGGLSQCLSGSGKCTDGYSTSAFEYMQKFGNYDMNGGAGDGTCKQYANTSAPRSETYGNPLCDENIRADVTNQIQAALARKQDFINTYYTPPAQLGQVANTPCMSNELQRINRQFGGMVQSGVRGVGKATGIIGSGPISSIINSAFKGDFNTFKSVSSLIPGMFDFQSMASNALGGMLDQLGLGSTFSSQMCGLMLDMVLKYIQCESPIKFPNLSNMFGSLNLKLPNNCAGKAAREGLMGLTRSNALKTLSQTVPGF